MKTDLQKINDAIGEWTAPPLSDAHPRGDMPGDHIVIGKELVWKANSIFPHLLPLLAKALEESPAGRAVIGISGGSGAGKSGTASLLAGYLEQIGVGSYVLSGDNYPRRIPDQNDAERLRIYRCGGLRGLLTADCYTPERARTLRALQEQGLEAAASEARKEPWLSIYQQAGQDALSAYLGSDDEQDFTQLTEIVSHFKHGDEQIWLKRMGRTAEDLWYENVDFSNVCVLFIEWTHANSERYPGVDIPIFLNSTPEETQNYRMQRNRDNNTDSPFTATVLRLEQKMLDAQAERAKLIFSRDGRLLSYDDYRALMAAPHTGEPK